MNVVVVVTISEMSPSQRNDLSLRCFSSQEKADKWIEEQIDQKVKEYDLDPSKAVDGYFVLADGWNHTFQYDTHELSVE